MCNEMLWVDSGMGMCNEMLWVDSGMGIDRVHWLRFGVSNDVEA